MKRNQRRLMWSVICREMEVPSAIVSIIAAPCLFRLYAYRCSAIVMHGGRLSHDVKSVSYNNLNFPGP